MKRDVFAFEFEKLYKMPVFYVLTLMCIVFNIWLFYDSESQWLEKMETDAQFLKYEPTAFAEYYGYDYYAETSMDEIMKLAKLNQSHGKMADELIASNYEKLQNRMEEMTERESESLTITGANRLHSHLFAYYLKYMIIEGLLIICLTVVYSMHFEVVHRTEELALTTRMGFSLFTTKLMVSALFSMLLITAVMVVTFGVYFMEIDYSNVWNSCISSNFNTDRRTVNNTYLAVYPYVTWFPMTIKGYLAASLGMTVVIFSFFLIFMGLMTLLQKNTVAVLALTAAGMFGMYFMGEEMHFASMLEYVVKFTPVHLVAKCGYWFMDYAPGDTWPMYEAAVLGVWTAITGFILRRKLKG